MKAFYCEFETDYKDNSDFNVSYYRQGKNQVMQYGIGREVLPRRS